MFRGKAPKTTFENLIKLEQETGRAQNVVRPGPVLRLPARDQLNPEDDECIKTLAFVPDHAVKTIRGRAKFSEHQQRRTPRCPAATEILVVDGPRERMRIGAPVTTEQAATTQDPIDQIVCSGSVINQPGRRAFGFGRTGPDR